jgi:hypothetical protein
MGSQIVPLRVLERVSLVVEVGVEMSELKLRTYSTSSRRQLMCRSDVRRDEKGVAGVQVVVFQSCVMSKKLLRIILTQQEQT